MELTEKKGTELLKKVIQVVVKDAKLGAKIAEGGITKEDIVHVPALIKSVQEIIELIGAAPEVVAEAKDLDAIEVGELLMVAWSDATAKVEA
jgi:hypothetical protein